MAEMERSSGPGNGQKLEFMLELQPAGSVVDGVPVYTVSDDTLISVEVDTANPLHGFVLNKNTLGTGAIVHVECDADLGAGVTPLTLDSEPIDVTDHPAVPATGLGFTFTPVAA